jgi:hypothetical protein
MKRILLIMTQPPGCSGVQGLRYNKLLPYLESEGWEFHFAGPSPRLVSVLTESLDYPDERLHYTDRIPFSRRFSVEKNRHAARSLPYLLWGGLQLISSVLERIFGHDPAASLRRGLTQVVMAADRHWDFDLIAGKTPSFETLETAAAIARRLQKPFVSLVWDPHGYRNAEGFIPSDPERQKAVLDQSVGALFLSGLTRDRYVADGLVDPSKTHEITDSYSEMPALYSRGRSDLAATDAPFRTSSLHRSLHLIHLGVLPQWRPIEPLLDAFEEFNATPEASTHRVHLHQFGFLYPEAQSRIQNSTRLDSIVSVSKSVSYTQSHWLAEDADVQLVVIGPRHLDNQPSKFFEYLGHGKPLLVLGPPGNPIEAIVQELGIGLYADVSSSEEILNALRSLAQDDDSFRRAYLDRREDIRRYSASSVAAKWCDILDSMESSPGS